jgi:hypothetical protein
VETLMDPVGAWLLLLLLDHVSRKRSAPPRARRWARQLKPYVVRVRKQRALAERRSRAR